MRTPNIKSYNLQFKYMEPIEKVTRIVIHHTGYKIDTDWSAETIHRMHLAKGWSGIGYNFVIRKNGQIEEGRPLTVAGAHTEGYNKTSIGIHLSGNFELVEPTKNQIESVALLVGYLCKQYKLEVDKVHVVGHRDLNATACPGKNVYKILQTIRGKALYYQQH